MFCEDWMRTEVVLRGDKALEYYIKSYDRMPSCKTNKQYLDCMYEKSNHVFEKTIEKFPNKIYQPIDNSCCGGTF